MSGSRIRARAKAAGRGATKYRQTVQWKRTNVQDGVVVVDQTLLGGLIKKEPIEKYYSLDPEPFATGMFASVRRCRSLESGEVLAAKFSSRLRYGEDCTREIHHEIALLSLCSPSARIVRLHDVFQTPKEFIIVMEYAPGGDMQTIIDDNLVPFESDVVKFVQHVVEGLAYLHHRKIAHLDIKPQNLVMMGEYPECDIKVCDFEISRVILEGSEIHEVLGTPEYVAPEILHYEPITLAADMWSLGVTTYVLLTGFSPFGGETDQETFLNISRAQVDFPEELFEDVSEEAKDFIRRLLVRKPSARMTAKECLRHPWLANNKKSPSVSARANKVTSMGRGGPVDQGPDHPRRAGCQSCPAPTQSSQNLRKYLSKSREALFEKVVCQQKLLGKQQEDLRKSTLLQRYNKTMRLCESQMSLVSKTREMAEDRHAITRSREKLYGLRCLSKSHEVLNLYKSLVNLRQIEEIEKTSDGVKVLPGILKTLTRTPQGDLTSVNISGRDQTKNRDDNIDNRADLTFENNNGPAREEFAETIRRSSCVASINTDNTEEKNVDTEKQTENDTTDLVNNNVIEPKGRCRPTILLTDLTDEQQIHRDLEPPSPAVSHTDSLTLSISTSESDISEEDVGGTAGRMDPSTEEDEPRYTVAQLVSAYNRHQEIVTKTSLEVTMNSGDAESKMAPVFEKADNLKFPTGANALRLFIPDINISSRPKRATRKKTGVAQVESPTIAEDEAVSPESPAVPDENGAAQSPTIVEDRSPAILDEKGRSDSTAVAEDKLVTAHSPTILIEKGRSESLDKIPLIHEMTAEKTTEDTSDSLSSRLSAELPPPKYLRSGSVSGEATKATPDQPGKPKPVSNVAKTVELFNNVIKSTPRPNRKSFSSPRSPSSLAPQPTDKVRRKSSPPTMKPCF